MKKRKAIYPVIAMMLCLLLTACSGRKTTPSVVVQPENQKEMNTSPSSEETSQTLQTESNENTEESSIAKEQTQEDSEVISNKYDVEVWDEALVNDVRNQICNHYKNLYNPEGDYAIFDESDITTEDASTYTMFLRYQMSDSEAEEMINSGRMPQANTLVTEVYINKQTKEVSDDLGNDIWMLE